MWTQREVVQRAQKKELDEMKSIKDFDHVQKYQETMTADKQQPREL